MSEKKRLAQLEKIPIVRTIAMPADTNPSGDIFGGWLMAQMDMAGGSMGHRICGGRCATVAVDSMQFHRPVKVGDEVSLFGKIKKIGFSSVQIHIEAWRRGRDLDSSEKVTEAIFTFVALDKYGKKRQIDPERNRCLE